jgi:hypothetical protein
MKKYDSFKDFMYAVADYIDSEYDSLEKDGPLSGDEKYTIQNIGRTHYESGDNISNTAYYICKYLSINKQWTKENLE